MPNRLEGATSPYLLQHKHNPVHWQPWGEHALAEARAADKPILLSIGYAACHWCHVMAHESFEDEAIAALMNELFVSVKVDREERPDLDSIYQQALALMGQQGGWPLTMFLTPAGEPFWGGTYFPPEQRHGRPGFPDILRSVAKIWNEERHKVEGNRQALREALGRLASPEPGDELSLAEGRRAARQLMQEVDTVNGGLGAAPKFPQAPVLELFWRYGLWANDPAMRHAVLRALARMSQGGIYDHLGGGFARYAVDAMWLVPHFEKMLYDNAQLLGLLAEAHAATSDPLLAARAGETVAWLEREMMVEGAFASSLDADSEGEEGRYYVWDAAEIDEALGADAAEFRLAYGVKDGGNFEGRNVLNRLHEPGLRAPEDEARLERMRAALLARRAARVRPGLDDKLLADWNGLMISALAGASAALDRPAWLALAQRAFAAVLRLMAAGDRLHHSYRAGRRLDLAFLDDYAQMARAALALFEQTGDRGHLEQARRWAEVVEADFRDPAGGYFLTAEGAGAVLVRAKNAHDGPTPAANATFAAVLARLYHLTGEDGYRRRATEVIRAFAGEARRNPFVHATLFVATLELQRPVQVVLVGAAADPGLQALRRAACRVPLPARLLHPVAPQQALPPSHPAAGKAMRDGRATAYVCVGPVCRPPVDEPEALARLLVEEASADPAKNAIIN